MSDHVNHLSIVCNVLKNNQLFSKYSKLKLWLRSVSFLGHIVYSEGVKVDPRKMKVVKSCPRPLSH